MNPNFIAEHIAHPESESAKTVAILSSEFDFGIITPNLYFSFCTPNLKFNLIAPIFISKIKQQ